MLLKIPKTPRLILNSSIVGTGVLSLCHSDGVLSSICEFLFFLPVFNALSLLISFWELRHPLRQGSQHLSRLLKFHYSGSWPQVVVSLFYLVSKSERRKTFLRRFANTMLAAIGGIWSSMIPAIAVITMWLCGCVRDQRFALCWFAIVSCFAPILAILFHLTSETLLRKSFFAWLLQKTWINAHEKFLCDENYRVFKEQFTDGYFSVFLPKEPRKLHDIDDGGDCLVQRIATFTGRFVANPEQYSLWLEFPGINCDLYAHVGRNSRLKVNSQPLMPATSAPICRCKVLSVRKSGKRYVEVFGDRKSVV